MAAHLGVGWRFLLGQAAQGPMVAPVAWRLDVWSLQSVHWQGHAPTGKLPLFFFFFFFGLQGNCPPSVR